MAFDDLHPLSKEYIETLAANIEAATHGADVIRYSGDLDEPRARIVQKAVNEGEDFVMWMEGWSAGD